MNNEYEAAMSATYGAGILGMFEPMDETSAVAAISSLFTQLQCAELREVIGERVGQWTTEDFKEFDFNWIDDEDGCVEFVQTAGGSAPYGLFRFLDGWEIMVPTSSVPVRSATLTLPTREADIYMRSIEDFVNCLEYSNEQLLSGVALDDGYELDDYLAHHYQLIVEATRCQRLKLFYRLGL